MNIFAIDLGNKRVKMKSDRGEYVYPASYLVAENVTRGVLDVWQPKGNQVYAVDKEDNRFVWGTELDAYHLSEKMIDTYGRSGRIEQKKAQRILEFALGRLALDYKESRTKPLAVNLVLGVPITDMHQDSHTIQTLKELMIGRHYIQVDGEELIVEIPSEDYLLVVPQYMGTAFELAYDEAMHPIDAFANGRMGILDIGGGTILVNTSNHLNPAPMGAERFEGVQTLIKRIAEKINSTKLFTIERLLREGSTSGSYLYQPSRNTADSRDISSLVKKAIEDYTRFTVAPLITENFPDIEDADFIVMTGGGANIIDKTALLDEIGQAYFDRLVFISSSELANVRGFYKYAVLSWSGSREMPTPEKRDAPLTAPIIPMTTEETPTPVVNEMPDYSDQLQQVQSNLKRLRDEIDQEI
ncbi:hypothetical protein FACS1894192_00060 [Bacilli bacterium]|nr:hypothetical protein FACS1894192_00060 [Bacilli bacterium]